MLYIYIQPSASPFCVCQPVSVTLCTRQYQNQSGKGSAFLLLPVKKKWASVWRVRFNVNVLFFVVVVVVFGGSVSACVRA